MSSSEKIVLDDARDLHAVCQWLRGGTGQRRTHDATDRSHQRTVSDAQQVHGDPERQGHKLMKVKRRAVWGVDARQNRQQWSWGRRRRLRACVCVKQSLRRCSFWVLVYIGGTVSRMWSVVPVPVSCHPAPCPVTVTVLFLSCACACPVFLYWMRNTLHHNNTMYSTVLSKLRIVVRVYCRCRCNLCICIICRGLTRHPILLIFTSLIFIRNFG